MQNKIKCYLAYVCSVFVSRRQLVSLGIEFRLKAFCGNFIHRVTQKSIKSKNSLVLTGMRIKSCASNMVGLIANSIYNFGEYNVL
jgi:hypothetical protein